MVMTLTLGRDMFYIFYKLCVKLPSVVKREKRLQSVYMMERITALLQIKLTI